MNQRICRTLQHQGNKRQRGNSNLSVFRSRSLSPWTPHQVPNTGNPGGATSSSPLLFHRHVHNPGGSSGNGSRTNKNGMMRFHSTSMSPSPSPRTCRAYNISGGTVPYEQAWLWQQRLLHERIAWQRNGTAATSAISHDVLLLLEHPSVYTLGRGSSLDHLRFDPMDPSSTCGREVRRTERGGEVTWHGPGQIVGYPVLDLNFHKKDLHWYLRQLEEVVIRLLGRYGLEGERETEHTGVWVGGAKVAAIGLNASRWITSHGFSINVNPDLRAFQDIVPCGIQDRPVTSLDDLVGAKIAPLSSPDETGTKTTAEGEDSGAGDTATTTAAEALTVDARTVRSLVLQEFKGVFDVEMEVVDVHVDTAAAAATAEAGGDRRGDDNLGRKIFDEDCDPKLLKRLKADSNRQLELKR